MFKRDDTKRKLDKLLSKQRRQKLIVTGMTGILVLLVAASIQWSRTTTSESEVEGVITWAVWKINSDTGKRYPSIEAQLDDGRHVLVNTVEAELPLPGTRIQLTEEVKAGGYRSYRWLGHLIEKEAN